MTSNGVALARRLPALVDAGLTHLNLSLDTMDPFKFEIMTRRPAGALDKVLAALDLAQSLPLQSVKLNVVVLKGLNDSAEELKAFVDYTRDHSVVIRFIEVCLAPPADALDPESLMFVRSICLLMGTIGRRQSWFHTRPS